MFRITTNKPVFSKLKHDLTKLPENKIQGTLRKLKTRFSTQQYYQLYPTGPFPVKFYGTAKLHKLPINGIVQDLPIWPKYQILEQQAINQQNILLKCYHLWLIQSTLLGVS